MSKILIKGAKVLCAEGSVDVADILIVDDRIATIGSVGESADATIIDGRNKFATPGLVNAHTHASMTLLRSYADDLALMDWLNNHIWPIEAKMERADIYWGAALAAVEMIKSGTTAFADMYGPCMEEVAKVVDESGMRGVLCQGLIGIFDGDRRLDAGTALFNEWHGKANGRVTVMFGPHAVYTCPLDYLKKIADTASKCGAEIHMHMNETLDEINGCLKEHGKRPFEVVNETGLLDLGMLAAHCVHLSDAEIDLMVEKKVRVAHNPGSNMKISSGICPIRKLIERGLVVGVGTDGASSNNNLDMLEEIRLATLLSKVSTMDPLSIPALETLKLGTLNSAKAIGLKDVGELREGLKADIVLWDMSGADWQPNYNPISLLAYSAQSSSADTVIVDGQVLMEGRQLKTLDEEKIIAEFNACFKRLTGN
ncbi:MAG: amidohydrolase [Selenomonadaceae bacterium]|nr:amidohydrolase [Selenomonadaceae bacterium]